MTGKRGLAALFVVLAAGCTKPSRSFEGNYHSTWGACVVVQAQEDVAITYSRGSMRCTRTGETLACGWQSGTAKGKALLTRHPDRSLVGTWGRDASDSDGGAWVMIPET